ncbi:MAG: alpha/beta hydrolase [Flavobacteriaceae bacterium]
MKKTLKILGIFLLLVIGYFVMGMYTPVQYEAPHMTPRESTKYWQLSTGSRIAYTHLTSCDDMGAYPVIYLHGGPGGYVYSENIKVLKPLTELGFDVYLYDQIGSGLSKRLENIAEYSVSRHIADLQGIINKIDSKKVNLVGHSWGAVLASTYAAHNPERVNAMVFSCPGSLKPEKETRSSLPVPDSLQLIRPYDPNSEANSIALSPRFIGTVLYANVLGKKLAGDGEIDAFFTRMAMTFTKGMVCDSAKVWKE